VLQARCSTMKPSVAVSTCYSLALLDWSHDGTAEQLVLRVLPRSITDLSTRELVNLAFAIVMLDVPAAEIISFALEHLARLNGMINRKEAHALNIIQYALLHPASLRPRMRESFLEDKASLTRCHAALGRLSKALNDVPVEIGISSSKLQERLGRHLDRLSLPRSQEEPVGPYVLDFALPGRVAIEVNGYKHYYAFSQRLNAKSVLKVRILEAMGWKVVSLPHFEWLPRTQDERLIFLAKQIEEAAGCTIQELRRHPALPGMLQEKKIVVKRKRGANKPQAPRKLGVSRGV